MIDLYASKAYDYSRVKNYPLISKIKFLIKVDLSLKEIRNFTRACLRRTRWDREKLEGGKKFVLNTEFTPAGDQPSAIKELVNGILANEQDQVLLGATGTGKTFTMAHILRALKNLR